MSKPATPSLRYITASSAISSVGVAWRIEVTSWRTSIVRPAARTAATPSAMPSRTASIA
jgi:hypothetical protein